MATAQGQKPVAKSYHGFKMNDGVEVIRGTKNRAA